MSMTKSSSQYFEKIAGDWDTIRSGYFSESVRETAIAKAYLRPEMAVADIGCGTGFLAAGLAPLVQIVHALDGSTAMLEVARKNLASFDQKIEYHVADGQSLPLPDNSVDAVFANMYLHHCPDPLAAITEMTRILRPGGRLVITDLDSHPHEWLKEEMADVWSGFERPQIKGWYEKVGLVNNMVDCTGQSCCAESSNETITDDQGRSVEISIFVAVGTKRQKMRDKVKQTYTETAIDASKCGCGSEQKDCCSGQSDESPENVFSYSSEEKSVVPDEAGSFSLGCGNPTAMAHLKPGEVVLDIGSGGGMDSFLAAAKVGPNGKVIGVDMTPVMLERASQTAQKSGISNVEFRQGFAEALPVKNNTVDVVISNCVVNLCEDKAIVFQEAYRVLKSGGRLELSDIVTGGPLSATIRDNPDGWSACQSGALPESEYLDLISQAGFNINDTKRSSISEEIDGVSIYSLVVSAGKGWSESEPNRTCSCCCE